VAFQCHCFALLDVSGLLPHNTRMTTPARPFILHDASYRQLREQRPNLAILPWGATEAHNYHLPHGTDVIEATAIAERSAAAAVERGAKLIVLPAIPFGNNAQQLDQVATIHLSTATALAILSDVAHSLQKQGIDRLVILNGHGGNDFKPLVRDVQERTGLLIVVINFFQLIPDKVKQIFAEPGDHAGELETSLIMHLRPELVAMEHAGRGSTVPMNTTALKQPGVWTPRPWSRSHPDTGAGDPQHATPEKGAAYLQALIDAITPLLVELSTAPRTQLP
jgi:creatinine amidohydrolase